MANGCRYKIVVFGAFGAGKTTLIRTLDPRSKHVEVDSAGGTTTVALDFGRTESAGKQIYLFGTPGNGSSSPARSSPGEWTGLFFLPMPRPRWMIFPAPVRIPFGIGNPVHSPSE